MKKVLSLIVVTISAKNFSTLLTLNVIQGHEMKHKHQQSAFLAINNPSSKPLLLALKRNRLNHILNLPQITLVL